MEEKAGKAKMCASENDQNPCILYIAYTYLNNNLGRCFLYKELINLLTKMRYLLLFTLIACILVVIINIFSN